MKRYSEWSPTRFDARGLACADAQDWLVAPVILTRDSDALETSNWEVAVADIDSHDRGDDVQVHRFNHWGPGWFEILLVRPGSAAAECAEQWEAALADYPIADDDHYSALEADWHDQGMCGDHCSCCEAEQQEEGYDVR